MSLTNTEFAESTPPNPLYQGGVKSPFIKGGVISVVFIAAGLIAAHQMDAQGHHITGMNNQVVWGLPHVFALTLILAASGALTAASLYSVFGVQSFKGASRLSAVTAIALLLGGLAVLLLDLGRPERLLIALTHYNFASVFAWNVFLYGGFAALAIAYLFSQMEYRARGFTRMFGVLSFVWRFVLTAGSGAIFALINARPGFDSALLIPLFIALSLSLGGAAFLLFYVWLARADAAVVAYLSRFLLCCVAAVLFFTALFFLAKWYAAASRPFAMFILHSGGAYTALFWLAASLGAVAIILLCRDNFRAAAALALLAGFVQLYVVIIGGQAMPSVLFANKIVHSSFYDGEVAMYSPALAEWALGFGGVGFALGVVLAVARVFPSLKGG